MKRPNVNNYDLKPYGYISDLTKYVDYLENKTPKEITTFKMKVNINNKEFEALNVAWEQINHAIEGMDDQKNPELYKQLNDSIKGINSIIRKYKKQ